MGLGAYSCTATAARASSKCIALLRNSFKVVFGGAGRNATVHPAQLLRPLRRAKCIIGIH